MFFADFSEPSAFGDPRVGEEDVDPTFELLHFREKAIQVRELGDVALHRRHIPADLLDGSIELALAATRNEDVGTIGDQTLRRRQTNSAVAPGDDRYLSIELSHSQPRVVGVYVLGVNSTLPRASPALAIASVTCSKPYVAAIGAEIAPEATSGARRSNIAVISSGSADWYQ